METVDGVLTPAETTGAGGLFAGPRYESPFGLGAGLSEVDREQCESFAREGFLILDNIGLGDVESLSRAVAHGLEPLHAGGFNRIQDAWSVSEPVRQIATAPVVLRTLETLYGRPAIPFQTLNFLRGSQQATHSDAAHFHSVPRHFMCGVWVAFEPVGPENGPLHYYPGSHTRPILEYVDLGLDPAEPGFYGRYEAVMARLAESAGLEKRTLSLHAGQAMIWAAGLWHGGEPIANPESTRRTQVTHYFFEDCIHYAPRLRDLQRNKMGYLHYRDIRTGAWRRPTYGQKRVRVGIAESARLTAKELAYALHVKQYVRRFPS